MNEVNSTIRAVGVNCTLKPSPTVSSAERLLGEVLAELEAHGADTEQLRLVDLDIRAGVEADMGDGDQWPNVRARIIDADILVVGTPTWLGHMSSVAQRVLERLDAELSQTDAEGRPVLAGKVAIVAVVGNEDGAHKVSADLYQALNDVGFSIPAQGGTYWNGEAMHTTDYLELAQTPEKVLSATSVATANAFHLARTLKSLPYPPPSI
jgi:multimeric flavodoxin WrbA